MIIKKPYQIIRTYYGEMETISYPFFEDGHEQIMVLLVAGDPTTMKQVRTDDLQGLIRAMGIEVKS